MNCKTIDRSEICGMKKLIATVLLCSSFNLAFAQTDPYGPKPKPGTMPPPHKNLFGMSQGVAKIESLENLPAGIKDIAKKHHEEMTTKGYIEAPDDEVTYLKKFPQMVRPLSSVEGNLKIKLSNLNSAAFHNLKFEGIVPEGPTLNGPWTSVSRIYSLPNGAIVRLFEWDYVADGGGVTFQQETLNEIVNGHYKAIFSTKKSSRGNAISSLTWATEKKYYTLTMTGHVRGNGMYNQFMAFANSIQD